MADNIPALVASIDLDRIRHGDSDAVADAIRLLQDGLNNEILTRAQIVAPWKDVVFNASNFLAAGGTWTVAANQVYDCKYLKFGTLVILQFGFGRNGPGENGTALNPISTLTQLGLRIPELRAKATRKGASFTGSSNGYVVSDNGGSKAGWCYVLPIWNATDEPGCVLNFELTEGTTFDATQPQGLSLFGIVAFEIEG